VESSPAAVFQLMTGGCGQPHVAAVFRRV